MVETFQQESNGAVGGEGDWCSGDDAPSSGPTTFIMRLNGDASATGTFSTVVQALRVDPVRGVHFVSGTNTPYLTNWAGGDWTIRINYDSVEAGGDLRLEDIFICRLAADKTSLESVTNRTGLGITLGAGVDTITVTNVRQVTAEVTNRIGVICSYVNDNAGTRFFQVTPNQAIDTPFTIGPRDLSGTSA